MSAATEKMNTLSGAETEKFTKCTCGRYPRETLLESLSASLSRSLSGEFHLFWK